jgi:predicted permease
MREVLQDVAYAWRVFRRAPAVAGSAVLSIAVTVGLGAVVFTAAEAVLLKPLPYQRPQDLVQLSSVGRLAPWVSWSDMQDVARRARSFSSVGVYHYALLNLKGTGGSLPEALYGLYVSASLFPTLGVTPMIGRNILPEEDQPGRNHEIVLSYGLWKRLFGGDRNVIGRSLTANGYEYRIIAVMPAGFDFPLRLATTVRTPSPYMEFWAPIGQDAAHDERRNTSYGAVARLRAGVSEAEADQELASIAKVLGAEYPRSNQDRPIRLVRLVKRTLSGPRASLGVLMAAAVLFLLIGCSNVANLLLARSLARRHELAVRSALGASRWRILRQLMTESCVLAAAGGVLGYLLAFGAWRALPAVVPQNVPRLAEAAVDWRVFLFALAAAIGNGVLFGIAPAWDGAGVEAGEGLRGTGGRGWTSGVRDRARTAIVIAEVAFTVVLVVAGVQLGYAFVHLMSGGVGFEPKGLLASIIVPQGPEYQNAGHWEAFYRRLVDRARALPGVESAGVVDALPFSGENNGAYVRTDDMPASVAKDREIAEYDLVSAEYLQTLGVRLLRGRWFTRAEEDRAPDAVLIDERAARTFFSGRDPVGRRICVNCTEGQAPDWKRVIGVVSSIRHASLDAAPDAEIYAAGGALTAAQFLVLRVRGRATDLVTPLRELVTGIDPAVPVYLSAEMTALIGDSVQDRRFLVLLLALTAMLALLLAAGGLYGVVSYTASMRTREIGVRMALGASRGDVRSLVLLDAMGMTAGGVAIGVAGAIAATRVLSGMLAGLGPAGAGSVIFGAGIVTVTAAAASLIPARRAMRVDPMVALRHE